MPAKEKTWQMGQKGRVRGNLKRQAVGRNPVLNTHPSWEGQGPPLAPWRGKGAGSCKEEQRLAGRREECGWEEKWKDRDGGRERHVGGMNHGREKRREQVAEREESKDKNQENEQEV